ncbi:MAG TPA: mannose-1-phosphate guanylyltransferase [Chthoniobacterales bacterium]
MSTDIYVLILAGGSGERFWPLSRRTAPKQLLNLFSPSTLLEDTLSRLEGFVPLSNILILTNRDQEPAVRKLCSKLPPENIFAEPAKRDTAAAIALGSGLVALRNPEAAMIVLPADHLIRDTEAFQNDLKAAVAAAKKTSALVTIGIKPTWACSGFGYIEQGAPLPGDWSAPISEVERFREKPNPQLAESFFKQGNFRWNAGMFIWTIPSILAEFHKSAPEMADFVTRMRETADVQALVNNEFAELPKISVDYAIMEKADRVLVLEASFDWDDVGSWIAVANYLAADSGDNRSNTVLTTSGAANNIVFSKRKSHVALLGVSDLIIVETDDALLVASRHEAEAIKQIVKDVPPELQ